MRAGLVWASACSGWRRCADRLGAGASQVVVGSRSRHFAVCRGTMPLNWSAILAQPLCSAVLARDLDAVQALAGAIVASDEDDPFLMLEKTAAGVALHLAALSDFAAAVPPLASAGGGRLVVNMNWMPAGHQQALQAALPLQASWALRAHLRRLTAVGHGLRRLCTWPPTT